MIFFASFSKTSMKVRPMILRFRSGSVTPLRPADEGLPRPGEPDVHLEILGEEGQDLLPFPEPQQAVVDEDAGELAADRPVEEDRRDGGVHPPREPEDHPFVADGRADLGDGVPDEGIHRPALGAFADAEEEVLQDLLPFDRMDHLRMELEAVEPPLGVLGGGHLGILGGGGDRKARREPADLVAVAHPAARPFPHAGKELSRLLDDQFRETVFPLVRPDDLAPQGVDHELQAVADPEDRDPELEDPLVHPRRSRLVDRGGAAGEDDPLGLEGADLFEADPRRFDLAVDLVFPDAPGDELVVLGSEIDDQDHG